MLLSDIAQWVHCRIPSHEEPVEIVWPKGMELEFALLNDQPVILVEQVETEEWELPDFTVTPVNLDADVWAHLNDELRFGRWPKPIKFQKSEEAVAYSLQWIEQSLLAQANRTTSGATEPSKPWQEALKKMRGVVGPLTEEHTYSVFIAGMGDTVYVLQHPTFLREMLEACPVDVQLQAFNLVAPKMEILRYNLGVFTPDRIHWIPADEIAPHKRAHYVSLGEYILRPRAISYEGWQCEGVHTKVMGNNLEIVGTMRWGRMPLGEVRFIVPYTGDTRPTWNLSAFSKPSHDGWVLWLHEDCNIIGYGDVSDAASEPKIVLAVESIE